MKNKLILLLTTFIIPTLVNADTLKVGENTYSIDKLENPCEKVNLILDRYDDKGAVCLDITNNFPILYRVDNSGAKSKLTNQEYLDYHNGFDNTHYTFFDSEDIYKVSGSDLPGYIEVPYEDIDTNKIYVIITDDGDGGYSYSYTDEPGFVFDPALKYYEEINLALPKSADVKTDGSITYYKCNRGTEICSKVEIEDIKPEDVLSYYVENDNPYKEEKVATMDSELFEKIKGPKEGLEQQNYSFFKLPNKDIYYIFYEEKGASTYTSQVYTNDGNLVFENIDYFGIINDDLIYTIKDDEIVIYNTNKEVLQTIPGDYLNKLYNNDSRTIFSTDDTLRAIYEIKKLETEIKEDTNAPEKTPIIDLKNPDTGDTIISSLILGSIAIIGIIAITKHKRKEI